MHAQAMRRMVADDDGLALKRRVQPLLQPVAGNLMIGQQLSWCYQHWR
jgi:hypothetical protein